MKGFVIDIETDGLSLESNIRFVGVKDIFSGDEKIFNVYEDGYSFVKDELSKLFNSADVLVGYNINKFDLPLIKNFFEIKFFGKRIDLYKVVKNKEGLIEENFPNYKLKTVGEVLDLDVGKGDINYEVFKKQDYSEDELNSIYNYLKKDLRVTYQLFSFFDDYFSEFKEFLSKEDVRKFNHFACSVGTFVYKYLCKELDLKEEYEDNNSRKMFKGGLVFNPSKEYDEGKIYCFDFNSLYPHILMMGNLYSEGSYSKIGNWELKGKYNFNEESKITKLLRDLYLKRLKLKEKDDNREHIIKIIINTIYGISGNPTFKHFYDLDIAEDCTLLGRNMLKYVRERFEDKGYEFIYGDTDSLYIKDVFEDKDKLLHNKKMIVEEIKEMFPFPVDTFDLGIDYEIKRIYLSSKKIYMFQTIDDDVVLKGFQMIKNNSTPLSMKVFNEFIKPSFVKTGEYKFDFYDLVRECKKHLGNNFELVAKNFNLKPKSYYKTNTNIYFKLSDEFGSGNKLFIPNYDKGVGKDLKYILVDNVDEINTNKISLKKTLQELRPFCSNEDTLEHYINNEELLGGSQKLLEEFT